MTRITQADVASVAAIRQHFPALRRTNDGVPVAYFDGPGGTQVPQTVVDAMTDYLLHHNANTHWAYPSSAETDAILEGARHIVAEFLNAASPSEIAFGANMTTLTFHLGRALVRQWRAGDAVVVTELDHHANVDPWRQLAREHDLIVHTLPVDPVTCELDLDDLARLLSPRTRLVALGAASNAVGTMNDVARARSLTRDAGALLFVDAVHAAPHVLTDVRALGCDFLVCSAYKFYGPHVGILYGLHDRLAALDVPRLVPASDVPPEQLETGTLNHEGIAGAGAAVAFLASLAEGDTTRARLVRTFAELHARGQALVEHLWDGLHAIAGVNVYGPPPTRPRTPTVAFTVDGQSSTDVARALAQAGIFVSNGDFYATTLVARLGHAADGVVRAGCACYTTSEEVDRLLVAVAEIAAGHRV